MPSYPVLSYEVFVTSKGGFIRGITQAGNFQLGPLRFETIAAIATVVNGPNPEYDPNPSNPTFICGRSMKSGSGEPISFNFLESGEEIEYIF